MAQRRINLLPPELLAKRRSRQTLAVLGAAGIALIGLLGIIYGAQEVRVRAERSRLDQQEETNALLRAQVAQLADFEELQDELETKTELVAELTKSEIRWSVVLADISLVIPDEVYLTSFTGRAAVATDEEEQSADEQTAGIPQGFGLLSLNGHSLSHPDVAKWLTRLEQVKSFAFPYLSLSARRGAEVEFSSTVRLSAKALRANQRGGKREL